MRNLLALGIMNVLLTVVLAGEESEFKPEQEKLPVPPPPGAVVLFDGEKHAFRSMSGEEIDWPIQEGCLVSTKNGKRVNHVVSQFHFRDADIHVEFIVDPKGSGNSGVYLHGQYELQIFNSHGKEKPTDHDEGALYGFAKPLVNAARPAGEWQVYDIRYIAPRRDAEGKITEEGQVTAWLNGQKVQEKTRFGEPRSVYHPFRYHTTPYLNKIAERMKSTQVGPVFLQDHDSPTKFRNVWVKPLDERGEMYQEE